MIGVALVCHFVCHARMELPALSVSLGMPLILRRENARIAI